MSTRDGRELARQVTDQLYSAITGANDDAILSAVRLIVKGTTDDMRDVAQQCKQRTMPAGYATGDSHRICASGWDAFLNAVALSTCERLAQLSKLASQYGINTTVTGHKMRFTADGRPLAEWSLGLERGLVYCQAVDLLQPTERVAMEYGRLSDYSDLHDLIASVRNEACGAIVFALACGERHYGCVLRERDKQ